MKMFPKRRRRKIKPPLTQAEFRKFNELLRKLTGYNYYQFVDELRKIGLKILSFKEDYDPRDEILLKTERQILPILNTIKRILEE